MDLANDLSLQKSLLVKVNLIHGRTVFSIFHMFLKDHTILHSGKLNIQIVTVRHHSFLIFIIFFLCLWHLKSILLFAKFILPFIRCILDVNVDDIHIYIYIYIYIYNALLCHSYGFACQQRVLETFPGPGYLGSENGLVWLWHWLVNLYKCINSCIYI